MRNRKRKNECGKVVATLFYERFWHFNFSSSKSSFLKRKSNKNFKFLWLFEGFSSFSKEKVDCSQLAHWLLSNEQLKKLFLVKQQEELSWNQGLEVQMLAEESSRKLRSGSHQKWAISSGIEQIHDKNEHFPWIFNSKTKKLQFSLWKQLRKALSK